MTLEDALFELQWIATRAKLSQASAPRVREACVRVAEYLKLQDNAIAQLAAIPRVTVALNAAPDKEILDA